MADVVFRKAIEEKREELPPKEERKKEAPKEMVSEGEKEENLSPFLWRETYGKPFLAKLLGIAETYDSFPAPVRQDIEEIEDYFFEKIRKKEYGNSQTDYDGFLKYLEEITNAKHYSLADKIGKIAEFIKILKRAKEYGSK